MRKEEGPATYLQQLLEVFPPLPRQEASVCGDEVLEPPPY